MIWNLASALVAEAPAPASPGGSLLTTPVIPMILIFVAMWAVMSGSQRKRTKQHEAMMKTLKAGDRVTTTSGIIGTVVTVKDKSINLRSADTKLEVLKSAISEITEREGEPSQAQS